MKATPLEKKAISPAIAMSLSTHTYERLANSLSALPQPIVIPPGRGGEGMELEVDKAGRITSSNTSKEDILYSSFFK